MYFHPAHKRFLFTRYRNIHSLRPVGFHLTHLHNIPSSLATQEPGVLLFAMQMLRYITDRGMAGERIVGSFDPRVQLLSLWGKATGVVYCTGSRRCAKEGNGARTVDGAAFSFSPPSFAPHCIHTQPAGDTAGTDLHLAWPFLSQEEVCFDFFVSCRRCPAAALRAPPPPDRVSMGALRWRRR